MTVTDVLNLRDINGLSKKNDLKTSFKYYAEMQFNPIGIKVLIT